MHVHAQIPSFRARLGLAALLCLALLPAAPAQLVTAPAAAPAASARPGDVIQLSPFEVVSDATDTYEATNTTSLNGMNTPLNKAPLDARILNNTLISELGGGDVFKLLSDFGGLGAMLFGGGNEDQRGMQDGDQAQPGGLSSRGFTISEPRRDGFLRSSTSMFNAFDVESAEAINGSNNLLYGSGEAGGVVVINSKRARVRQNAYKFSAFIDSEGTQTRSERVRPLHVAPPTPRDLKIAVPHTWPSPAWKRSDAVDGPRNAQRPDPVRPASPARFSRARECG
jgi:outer membrane receptor protein involved in Fe transport